MWNDGPLSLSASRPGGSLVLGQLATRRIRRRVGELKLRRAKQASKSMLAPNQFTKALELTLNIPTNH